MKADIEIAREARMLPIAEIAKRAGVLEEELECYGNYKAKISLDIIDRLKDRPNGKYIDVTAITPTPLGEGKTVTTVGLGQALSALGKSSVTCIRQPSLGPVFGIKGGAAGGGYSQVIPMEDFNLHLTGDFHAVSAAHNLCAAFIDNHIYHGNELNINLDSISWTRAVDISDRSLRYATVAQNDKKAVPHEASWVITSASELMATLTLKEGLGELREAVGKIIVAKDMDGNPITTEDLHVAGAMTMLLKDCVRPTLMQNLEGAPVLVHTGPFANIAPGNSSITADRIGLKLADYVVTESGFGADMGCEKFFNIKCRKSGLIPDAVVLVVTVRALKNHSEKYNVKAGKPLPEGMLEEDLDALHEGMPNLVRHIENTLSFGAPVVVAINSFPSDTENEIQAIKKASLDAGAFDCVVHTMFADGARGGKELAQAVVSAAEQGSQAINFTYDLNESIEQKIEDISKKMYRAQAVEYSDQAKKSIDEIKAWGYADLPVCMAKTQLSISDNAKLKGAPDNWTLTVRDVKLSAGAGFVYVLCGKMMTMPGLPSVPAGNNIDIDADGNISGLF